MRFAGQKTAVWLLVGLFGTISLVGQCLHLLPGMGHPLVLACSRSFGCGCCSDGAHSHGTDTAATPSECAWHVVSAVLDSTEQCGDSSHHRCLICQFFSQAQKLAAPAVGPLATDFWTQPPAISSPPRCAEQPWCPYIPRAPPSWRAT